MNKLRLKLNLLLDMLLSFKNTLRLKLVKLLDKLPWLKKKTDSLAEVGADKDIAGSGEVPSIMMLAQQSGKQAADDGNFEDPRRIIRHGLTIIVLFFGVLGIWSIFGEISGAVVAQGKVKIDTERKTVQHLEGGIVDSILVREGDTVTAGQTLIVMESIQVDASVDMLRKQLTGQMAAQARYTAEKDLKSAVVWPEDLLVLAKESKTEDILDGELKIFSARQDALQGQISMLRSQISQIKTQISGLTEQSRAEDAIIRTLHEELEAKRQLFKERFLEKSQILELERMLATHQGSRGQLTQAIAEARQKNDEMQLRINDLTNRFVEDATNQLGRLDNEILQTKERLRPLHNAKMRLNVEAPVTGRVVELKVHSKGGVLRPGDPIMDIVPTDNPLIVEVQVPVNKITDVFIGQDAQVQLDAFDIRITPMIKSKVTYISADRLEERTNMGLMPYYMCYVEIDQHDLEKANLYLSPGMPATVFITTKSTTILYYMLEPLIKNWNLALRD
jgi:HlyD family type I secretion membrane fusion protein